MKPQTNMPGSGRSCLLLLMAAAALLSGCGKDASVGTVAVAPPVAGDSAATEAPPEPAALVQAMADHLASLKTFTLTARNSYEVLQPSGQKIEFGETRLITVARPDRMRVEEVSSDGEQDLALFDGKLVTVFNADAGVYAQAQQPESVDDALVYFVRDLRMRMPLSLMLSTRVGTELPEMINEIAYVESTELLGVPAHHIAGRTDSVDFQFWISQDERPLPLRVVISYREAPGLPQFRSDLSDWNTNAQVADTTFRLSLPEDAEQIPFAVQMQGPGSAPAQSNGEVKP
jgi:hypothetical protein